MGPVNQTVYLCTYVVHVSEMPTRADLDLEESLPAIMPFVVSIGRPD